MDSGFVLPIRICKLTTYILKINSYHLNGSSFFLFWNINEQNKLIQSYSIWLSILLTLIIGSYEEKEFGNFQIKHIASQTKWKRKKTNGTLFFIINHNADDTMVFLQLSWTINLTRSTPSMIKLKDLTVGYLTLTLKYDFQF